SWTKIKPLPDIERQNDFASRTSFKKSNELYYEFTNSDFVEVTCSSKDKKWKSFLAAP
ncbi:unnamed protein product, partial [Allacma fusca]